MLIPAAPSTKSLQGPNVVRIVRLQAEIGKLESLKEGKNENDRATIDNQINQRKAEQLILYKQLPGHENTKETWEDFKVEIGKILEGMKGEMTGLIAKVKADAKAMATDDGKAEAAVNDSLKSQLAQLKAGLELFPSAGAKADGHAGGGAVPGGGARPDAAAIAATTGARVEGTRPSK